MVRSVARAMECSQLSPFCLKDLAVMNWRLAAPVRWIMLVDCCLRANGEKVFHAANVVRVPVCDDGLRYRGRL